MNIKVPEERLLRVVDKVGSSPTVRECCTAFAEDLSENPIVPTDEQAKELWNHPKVLHGSEHYAKAMARDWQRMMFLAPEPEYIGSEELGRFCARYQRIDEAVIEAYRRGKESK